MDRRGADPAVLKVQSLEGIGRSGLDEARRWFLAHVVETYLRLAPAAQTRYQQLLEQEEHQMAKQWDYYTWRDQMREEGRQEGEVRAKQDGIMMIMQARFAPVPEELRRRVEAIRVPAEHDAPQRKQGGGERTACQRMRSLLSPYAVLALDLDGTLLTDDLRITERSRA